MISVAGTQRSSIIFRCDSQYIRVNFSKRMYVQLKSGASLGTVINRFMYEGKSVTALEWLKDMSRIRDI